jgi:hypothetical protein
VSAGITQVRPLYRAMINLPWRRLQLLEQGMYHEEVKAIRKLV